MVIPTVAVEADKKENTVCPVCREEFDTFYKQVFLLLIQCCSVLMNALHTDMIWYIWIEFILLTCRVREKEMKVAGIYTMQ